MVGVLHICKCETLFFQITEENYGATEVFELVRNGEQISVNKSNRLKFYMTHISYWETAQNINTTLVCTVSVT